MIKNMKTLLHVGAVGIILSMSALGGASFAAASNDHGGHGGGGSSMSGGGGWSGMSGGGSGEHGGGHSGGHGGIPGRITTLPSGLRFGPTGSGSGGTEIDDSGLPVACGHVYSPSGYLGHTVCVTQ